MRPASEAEDTGEADHDAGGGACRLTGAGLDSRRMTLQIKPRAPRACPLYRMRSTALPWSSTQNGTFGTYFRLTIIQFGQRPDFRRATPNQAGCCGAPQNAEKQPVENCLAHPATVTGRLRWRGHCKLHAKRAGWLGETASAVLPARRMASEAQVSRKAAR